MAVTVLKNSKLYLGSYDLSGDSNEVQIATTIEMKDRTTFGSLGATQRAAGLLDVQGAYKGYWQCLDPASAPSIDPTLFAALGIADQIFTVCPVDGADGEIVYSMAGIGGEYIPEGQIGDLFKFSGKFQGSTAALIRNTILKSGTLSSNSNSSANQIGAVAAGKTLCGILHVFTVAGTGTPTLTMKIQSDDNSGFTSATDRLTFTNATAIGAELKTDYLETEITDTYWRALWTVTGTGPSFLAHVGLGWY